MRMAFVYGARKDMPAPMEYDGLVALLASMNLRYCQPCFQARSAKM